MSIGQEVIVIRILPLDGSWHLDFAGNDPVAVTVTGGIMLAATALAQWCGNEATRIYQTLGETPEQSETRRRGLTLAARGDALAVTPKRLLSPDFRDLLRAHNPGLLALLAGAECSPLRATAKAHRPLTERERTLLVRFAGREDDFMILTALKMFDGEIAG